MINKMIRNKTSNRKKKSRSQFSNKTNFNQRR